MKKSILKSVNPKILVNILNGDASLFVCKDFPKNFRGWVYLYCTKSGSRLLEIDDYELAGSKRFMLEKDCDYELKECSCDMLNGKVVARFYCDKVEEISYYGDKNLFWSSSFKYDELLKKSYLTYEQLYDYYLTMKSFDFLKALHFSQLEIFDAPRELIEFYKPCKNIRCKDYYCLKYKQYGTCEDAENIAKAPKNYCYVEEEK